MDRLFRIEAQPIKDHSTRLSRHDKKILDFFDKTTRLENGRYHVGIPWIKPHDKIAEETAKLDSREMAMSRLERMGRRFQRNDVEWEMAKTQIAKFKSEGFAEVIGSGTETEKEPTSDHSSSDKKDDKGKIIFYLPLLSVMDKRKPEKRRLCHDMAAKVSNSISLNDLIHKPPDIANRLDRRGNT